MQSRVAFSYLYEEVFTMTKKQRDKLLLTKRREALLKEDKRKEELDKLVLDRAKKVLPEESIAIVSNYLALGPMYRRRAGRIVTAAEGTMNHLFGNSGTPQQLKKWKRNLERDSIKLLAA